MAEDTFAIEYVYVPGMEERRTPHRAGHLEFLNGAADAGWLLLAGALTGPVDGGWFVVKAADAGAAMKRMHDDPYIAAGLVRSIKVRSIAVVVPKL